jgi:cell division protein FtsB
VEHGYADFRARREATVWQRLNRILIVLLIIAIWLVIVSLFLPPYKKLMQSRTEIDKLQQAVTEQQNLLARQTREVTLLKTDVSYLETIARDRLDLMKEGETIFRLETARAKEKPGAPVRKLVYRRLCQAPSFLRSGVSPRRTPLHVAIRSTSIIFRPCQRKSPFQMLRI